MTNNFTGAPGGHRVSIREVQLSDGSRAFDVVVETAELEAEFHAVTEADAQGLLRALRAALGRFTVEGVLPPTPHRQTPRRGPRRAGKRATEPRVLEDDGPEEEIRAEDLPFVW